MDSALPQEPPKKVRKNKRKSSSSKPIKSRLQHLESEDGWTHVTRGSKSSSKSKPPANASSSSHPLPTVQHCEMGLEELEKAYEYHRTYWDRSDACSSFTNSLRDLISRGGYKKITNVVCLALGTPSNIHMDRRADSCLQLAALETLRSLLELPSNSNCVMQDPVFSSLDTEFLEGKGYSVVQDPEALAVIGESSCVYMIHPEKGMYKAVLRGERPAVFISQDVANVPDVWLDEGVEEEKEILEVFKREYITVPWPQLGHTFSGIAVHWRREGEWNDVNASVTQH